jgi:putative ATP-dependent endonuclease of OLD family
MYLAEVFAENFRIFGKAALSEGEPDYALRLTLTKGVNALIGENDSGKTAIIDAIRYCLWTTSSQDYHRFTPDDFHCGASDRATDLTIRCKFEELSREDQGTFLELITIRSGQPPTLYITLKARRNPSGRARVDVWVHAGEKGDGPAVEGAIRELLRTTYLRPLRDAEGELSPGRNSRLSQILYSHPDIAKEAQSDYDPVTGTASTLVGVMHRAEDQIGQNVAVTDAERDINTKYLAAFQIGSDRLASKVSVASDSSLARILEKLELRLSDSGERAESTRRGLGYNNALFMSAELLLLGRNETYPTLLIEEPEAHLHPQLQSRVIELLNSKATDHAAPVQVVLTTHSPNLAASIALERITLVCGGKVFPLAKGATLLSSADYAFLERFLDVTKSNLFFAKAVAIVEGDAENLVLPALASKVGRAFDKHGVSIVKVGHTGLFRYSRIFGRSDSVSLPIRVACLRDRDIAPDGADSELIGKIPKEKDLTPVQVETLLRQMRTSDVGHVKTFVSDHWTFEYDLASASWPLARIMNQAVHCANKAVGTWPDESVVTSTRISATSQVDAWKAEGKSLEEVALDVYEMILRKGLSKAITAQFAAEFVSESDITLQELPKYIQYAFDHLCAE